MALEQVLRVAVIGDQHNAAQAGGSHRGQQVLQVFGQAAFPQHQVETETQLFPGLVELGAFVVGADPGQPIGRERLAGQQRRVAVHRAPGEEGQLSEQAGLAAHHPRKIHDLGQAQDPGAPAVRSQEVRVEHGPSGLQGGGGDAGGQHEKEIEGQPPAGGQQVVQARRAPDVGDFMGVRHHRGGSQRQQGPGQLPGG